MSETRSANGDSSPEPGKVSVPAPGQTERFKRLRDVLREMFQLDRGDLDFGLYRIMNLKRAEVERFLDEDLLPQARTLLGLSVSENLAEIQEELGQAEKTARALGVDPSKAPKVQQLRAEIEGVSTGALDEGDVYKHLTNFFERYYRDGDFAAQRRYSSGAQPSYLIPYDGEEVTLHWANADQYYIKTTENYASYVFSVAADAESGRKVRFEIAAAVGTRDNVREANSSARRFLLAKGPGAVAEDGEDLVVRFEHRPLSDPEKRRFPGNGNGQQKKINEETASRVHEAAPADWQMALVHPEPTETCPERTTLDRHLATYTARNSFDYFIHKDLGGFLRREFDLFLKTEVLSLDDLEPGDAGGMRRAVARMKAIKMLGEKIVAFLAQLEDFQKRLWLKKKFVLETQWCVTLDRVPEALYAEIAANEAQRGEWEQLYAISEIPPNLLSGGGRGTLTDEFLRANPYLVLDTRHFDQDFRDRLLAALSETRPLDEAQDGLLVHGENFQALNLLRGRYAGQVQCAYLDPPYNTDASAILYKNDYKDSSWLALMWDRLALTRESLTPSGSLCVAIDDEEVSLLRCLAGRIFERELGVVTVRSNPAGRKSKGQFSPKHEYALFLGRSEAVPGSLTKTPLQLARYPLEDEWGRYAWNGLLRHGSGDRREDRPTMFYPIYVDSKNVMRVPEMRWRADSASFEVLEAARDDEIEVWPVVTEDGVVVEKRWHRGWERIMQDLAQYRVRRVPDGGREQVRIDFKIRPDFSSMPGTWWEDKRYASANLGPKALKDLFGRADFDYAKAPGLVEDCLVAAGCGADSVVLDCFAGSGTTGHAVVNLNRADDGQRQYVLVEMGDHFDTVVLPRLKKVVHSSDWKDGKPISRKGISQFFRYLRIESYEDTMDSLTLVPRNEGTLGLRPDVVEDYRLRYAIDTETNGSATWLGSEFEDPFRYTLSVVRDGERRESPVDLPETFNLLLGLRERSRRRLDGVLAIEGEDAGAIRCLILWRNRCETDNRALDAWFREHRGRFDGFDRVYVNGDHTLNAVAKDGDSWTAFPIEPEFRRLMFEEA
ncbi:MAG: site-specific DNA-methyltransferase [Acidobacteria bacterium]|nr:site-specific DNA-methyltransferase [Acidobacteriota bacterium]MYE94519.1 site-specific DNA-methyltransferase [Gemmatimonadota bacterium]MYJ12204.1 site-specific DNA-methyltransferase [Gemmatimonadota bacterium]